MDGKRITFLTAAVLGALSFALGLYFSFGAFFGKSSAFAGGTRWSLLWPEVLTKHGSGVEWGALAAARMTACAAFSGVAALAYVARQVEYARKEVALNDRSARLNAYILKEKAARSRVETIWKGSELEFEKQEFDGEDFDRISRQMTDSVNDDEVRKKIVEAVMQWGRNKKDLDRVLGEFEQELENLEVKRRDVRSVDKPKN